MPTHPEKIVPAAPQAVAASPAVSPPDAAPRETPSLTSAPADAAGGRGNPPTFKRGQRVLYARSVLCGREPEYGVIVRRDAKWHDGCWYIVRDEGADPKNRWGRFCEHANMLVAA